MTTAPSLARTQFPDATVAEPKAARSARARRGRQPQRPEIQGLRALAVLMVVSYHVWLGRVSGGIDVFLLLSAFLMSGSLLTRLEAGERVSVPGHWVHTFWRLVPAAAAVIVATLAAAAFVLPATRWPEVVDQAGASLFYAENWLLADRAVDYYAPDRGLASPLQHFWSLSVQGQVFLLWPAVLIGLGRLADRQRLRLRPLVLLVFGVVFAASLSYSVITTGSRQQFAYFDTGARLWEFALGTLLAVGASRVRPGLGVRVMLGWVGVVGLLACGLVLDVTRSFPGFLALWPVLCGAAVVVAGRTGHRLGVDRVLVSPALRWLGDRSYALYLVHWPVLVLWLAASGRREAGFLDGAGVVAISVAGAWLLAAAVESPLRRAAWPSRSTRHGLLAIAAAVAVAAVPAGVWKTEQATAVGGDSAIAQTGARTDHPGAAALEPGAPAAPAGVEALPAVSTLRGEFASLPGRCSGAWQPSNPILVCGAQVPDGQAIRTMVVVGDSHAEQWLAALQPLAAKHRWRIVSLLKGGCSLGEPGSRTGSCDEFNRAALDYLIERRPDAVVTVATAAHRTTPAERMVPGYAGAVRALSGHGLTVVGLRDNPRFASAPIACALEHGLDAPECAPPRVTKLAEANPAAGLARVPGFVAVDLTDRICAERCQARVGNVWVYLDDNHLTKTYAATLAPVLEQRLGAGLGWPELGEGRG